MYQNEMKDLLNKLAELYSAMYKQVASAISIINGLGITASLAFLGSIPGAGYSAKILMKVCLISFIIGLVFSLIFSVFEFFHMKCKLNQAADIIKQHNTTNEQFINLTQAFGKPQGAYIFVATSFAIISGFGALLGLIFLGVSACLL